MNLLYTKKYQTGGTINSYIKDLGLKNKFMNASPLVEKEESRIDLSAPVGRWNPTAYGWNNEERLRNPNEYIKMGGAGVALPEGFRVDGMAQAMKFQDRTEFGDPVSIGINAIEGTLSKNLPRNLGNVGAKARGEKVGVSAPYYSFKEMNPQLALTYNVNKEVPLKNGYLGASAFAEKGLGKNENYRVGANINAEKYFTPKLSGNLEARYDKGKMDSNYNLRAGLKYRF